MKKIYKHFIAILILQALFSSTTINASHLVGGYISYQHISGNDYKIRLDLFYDCYAGMQGDSLPVCVKSGSLNYDSTYTVYCDTSYIYPYHPCLGTSLSCIQGGSNWGMSDNVFTAVVTLPGAAADWKFTASICCRNAVPATVHGSNSAMSTIDNFATLDNLNFPSNSSPNFNSFLMPLFCLGVYTVDDFSCTDPDGDSLIYELDSIYTGNNCSNDTFFSAEYFAPYSYLNFLDSSTPVTMNTATGALSFTPSLSKVAIFSVKITEYRNGIKNGSMKRQELIYVTPSTAIAFNNKQHPQLLFPNPAASSITIQLNSAEKITISNALGEILNERLTHDILTRTLEIDISHLLPGIYFVKAGNEVGRFIKE